MTRELLVAILSSSLLSGLLGAFIAGLFALRSRRNEYINEYYRLVLSKRLEAYEALERVLVMLRTSVVDDDKRPYHLLFSNDNDVLGVYEILFGLMPRSLWLSDQVFAKTRDLNLLLLKHKAPDSGLIEFGKSNYHTIAELRTAIEKLHAKDMLSLYDVKGFLKNKKLSDDYTAVS